LYARVILHKNKRTPNKLNPNQNLLAFYLRSFPKKKSLFALVGISILAGVAHARSSMTLHGLIDAGVAYTNAVTTNGALSVFSC
jgi:hypothetical protein